MKNPGIKIAVGALCALAMASISSMAVRANDEGRHLRLFTRLSTFNEVLPKGTGGHGRFEAKLSEDGTTLNWTLSWTGLTAPPIQAHIHFAQEGVNGNVMTFLCGGPAGSATIPQKPDCPAMTTATVTGTTTAADIIPLNAGASDQGLNAGDFATFLRAIKTGDGYANVHTPRFPGGEIRGQLAVIRDHNRDEDDD